MVKGKLALVLAAAASIACLTSGTAFAQSTGQHGKDLPPAVQDQTVYKIFEGRHSGDWTPCGYVTAEPYAQTATCSESVSVSTTIAGNIGYTISEIGSAAGFSVSVTRTVSEGYSTSVTVKPHGHGLVEAGIYYGRWKIGLRHRSCSLLTGKCGPWSRVDAITVQNYITVTARYTGTGAEK
jgi:hypothetical protein